MLRLVTMYHFGCATTRATVGKDAYVRVEMDASWTFVIFV